ncbi:MAG: nuclear transport factor 2 family protein [Acidobacteriota bacterium]|nr:nuclear transport factor 2 family protein [Acidobacteriota bacterium]
MKTVLLMSLVLLAANVSAQSTKKVRDIESAIMTVLNKQVDAWNEGDIEGFMDGYWKSDDMRFVSGNSVSKGWQAAFDRYRKAYDSREKMGVLSFSEIEFTVLSKRSAYVKGRFTLERKEDKPTGLFTLVFRRFDGEWKIVHDHTST